MPLGLRRFSLYMYFFLTCPFPIHRLCAVCQLILLFPPLDPRLSYFPSLYRWGHISRNSREAYFPRVYFICIPKMTFNPILNVKWSTLPTHTHAHAHIVQPKLPVLLWLPRHNNDRWRGAIYMQLKPYVHLQTLQSKYPCGCISYANFIYFYIFFYNECNSTKI